MTARFLLIALDGADGALLDRWSADGTLPSLARLRARGSAARLSAPAGITDDALWASFQYAASLGEHGRYHWLQRLGSGEMGMAYRDEVGRKAFWETLSSDGQRVAVFDVPKCGLPRPLNGFHLSDWLVHGRYFDRPRSYPEPLAAEIVDRFGAAPPSRCAYEGPELTDAEVAEVTANLRASVSKKRAAGLHYLSSESWDLFLIAFKEAHCAGHHFWEETTHAARPNERLRSIFMDLDAVVGDFVTKAGPGAAIAVFSTTDMEPNATLSHLMPEIINRINRSLGERLLGRAVGRLRRRRRLCELLPYNVNCTALRTNPPDDISRRRALAGRSKTELLEQIESMLRELTDADTGQPVVAAIDRPSAKHVGTRAAALPDLLIRYSAGTLPRAVISPRLGRIEGVRPPIRPGNHAAGGFLIVAGKPADGVFAMQDLGPMVAKALRVAI